MTATCRAGSPVAQDAMELLDAAGLDPHRVWIVEPDAICFVSTLGHARIAYIRYETGAIIVEAVCEGWPA